MSRSHVVAVLVAAALVVSQVAAVAAVGRAGPAREGPDPGAKIDKGILDQLEKGGTATFVVEFAATADLKGAGKIKDHEKKGQFVLDQLKGTAAKSQAAAEAAVVKGGGRSTSYWLTNVMVVEGDASLAKQLAALPGVTAVRPEKVYPLVKPVETKAAILAAAGDPEWGVDRVGADEAWAEGILGAGTVVANIDTGVDYLHPALVEQYRGNLGDGSFDHDYDWWDPTGICGDEPCDNAGHGTHTMGTMVGGDGPGPFTPDIGVAPGARWIAAKGCEDFGCSESALLSSGQFVLAPTDLAGENPDPSLRPDIVNNSWGGWPGDPFYLETVQAWRAAGIIPVFSSGNPGPFCGEGGSPGDFLESFSVGATDIDDVIAEFSGRGPSVFGKVNPDVSAPGVDVISSVPGGGYESYSGTSMAAPHTAGALALVLSAEPALIGDFVGATEAIRSTALDILDDSCGGDEDGDPNNVYGDGRIDAYAAVQLVATGGTLAGHVVDATTGDPIGGAKVTAHGARDSSTFSGADGAFQLFLAAGTYPVSVDAFGYYEGLATVEIVTDETTSETFRLEPKPRFHVTGTVRAVEDGSPIDGAAVRALGTPVAAATSDAAGEYDLELPVGSYTLRASAGGCTTNETTEVELIDADVSADFALARKLDAFGHGCRPIAFDWVDAEGQSALYGDEFAGRLRLPFDFAFYGETYRQVFLSDNGYLNFLGPDQYNPFPVGIPNEGPPNAAIYALWQDLAVDETSSIDYEVVGEAPDRTFVVEYSSIKAFGSTKHLDLEVKIHEGGETVDLLFGANAANPGDGRNATVGIEDATGTDALEFSSFEGLIEPSSAFRFEPMPVGVVRGVITDRNDGEPIVGAVVTAEPGLGSARTGPDGSYVLPLYPGSYHLTFSAKGYVADGRPLTLADGDDVTIDRSLAAPLPTVEPTELSATVEFGGSAQAILELANVGTAPLTWELLEIDRGSTPPVIGGEAASAAGAGTWLKRVTRGIEAESVQGRGLAYPKAYRWTAAEPTADDRILVYADDCVHPAPNTYVDQALQRLGLSYTAHYDSDFGGFSNDLAAGGWDLVIFADDCWFPDESIFDELGAWVRDGGKLVFYTPVIGFIPDNPLWETLGFSWVEDNLDPPSPVFWWDPTHPAFSSPEAVPELTEWQPYVYWINGQLGDPIGDAEAIAGATTPGPDPGKAMLVLANDGRTVLRTFSDGPNDADLDTDGVPDGAELWENLITGAVSGFISDAPWLSGTPTSGTLAAGESVTIDVTMGGPSVGPGTYEAAFLLRSDAPKPRQLKIPVTLTVELPEAFGAVTGTVVDAHTGEPLAGATVTVHAEWPAGTALELAATTAGDGTYTVIGPEGTWPADVGSDGYLPTTGSVEIARGTTATGIDWSLHRDQAHAAIDAGPIDLIAPEGQQVVRTLVLSNPEGHQDLVFEVNEVGLGGPGSGVAPAVAGRVLPTGFDPAARSTRGLRSVRVAVPPRLTGEGDVLAEWPAVGLDLPWGVGFDGRVWISDPLEQGDACTFLDPETCLDASYSPTGEPSGSFSTPWAGVWAADMAWDAGRGLLWQVNVGGDNGIYGLDPADGSVEQVITGSPWDGISQRGLAYDGAADVFYVGGWNEGIVYRVAGPSHPTPGETLSQCSPADPNISGLAWNPSFGLLWEATNSETDTIYLIDPFSCETFRALPHPAGGFGNGAGLEMDPTGNLWTVGQGTGSAYLIESGLPSFSDVPWLSVEPIEGSVAPDASAELAVTVDTTGLASGLHRGMVVVGTNDPDNGYLMVPVTVLVPAYQQGVNAGGVGYTAEPSTGPVAYAADRAWSAGGFGFVGGGSSRSTRSPIEGTEDDPLFQALRLGMTGYRFDVPDGHYQVELSFAELQNLKAGGRVFGVAIEGVPVLPTLDVAAQVGRDTALVYVFETDVVDGSLDVTFTAQRGDKPIVNAILVREWPMSYVVE